MRLHEHENWGPLVSDTAGQPSLGIRPGEAIFMRIRFSPPTRDNSAYLRLSVVQDGKEHIITLPFDDLEAAEQFNRKLSGMIGGTLAAIGSVEIDWPVRN
jgi:hypothetical protein